MIFTKAEKAKMWAKMMLGHAERVEELKLINSWSKFALLLGLIVGVLIVLLKM